MAEAQNIPALSGELLGERLFTSLAGRNCLECELLPAYISARRWFAGKARHPQKFTLTDLLPLGDATLLLVGVSYRDSTSETYLLPLKVSHDASLLDSPQAIVARSGHSLLIDAVYDPLFRSDLLSVMGGAPALQNAEHKLIGIAGSLLESIGTNLDSRLLDVEQSNTSIIYGEQLFLKLYRKLEEGVNPDAEITRFLTERRHFTHVAPFAGALEYHPAQKEPRVLGLALGMVPNRGDAWTFTLDELQRFYERASGDRSADLRQLIGDFLGAARCLGTRTAEMHLALGADPNDLAFQPEPFTLSDQLELAGAVRTSTERVFTLLRAARKEATLHRPLIDALLSIENEIVARTEQFETRIIPSLKIRTHGDYHLGQVLYTGGDFIIIDFEGEPLRPLAWRKRKRSPLRDVAGMLRSFHYAAHSALAKRGGEPSSLEALAEQWAAHVGKAFLDAWRATAHQTGIAPPAGADFDQLLEMFLLEKAIYEVEYELNNRPGWLPIPARGTLTLFSRGEIIGK
jgi:trehalose synthase-fused probable maltokinase